MALNTNNDAQRPESGLNIKNGLCRLQNGLRVKLSAKYGYIQATRIGGA
jgi:hypothetical protein